MSHKCNVVDRSVGKALKDIANGGFEKWLDDKDNRKRWTRKKITEQQRRVLATEFAGDAWQQLLIGDRQPS